MCLVRVRLDYGSELWLEDWDYCSRNEYSGVTVDITGHGISLSLQVALSKDDKLGIASGLHNAVAPHWQNIPVAQHRALIAISERIYAEADHVDMALRSIGKCYRLPAPQFSKFLLNQKPHCAVMTWILDDADREDLEPVLIKKQEHSSVVTDQFILLPFPVNYDRKQIYLDEEDVRNFERLIGRAEVIPYKQMYSEAYARFIARQHDAAVLMLATAVETAMKAYIASIGGSLLEYMLDKMASPSLENLFVASVDHCGLKAPADFKSWLNALRVKRNEIAHKSKYTYVDPLEVGRWIAVVEAILSSIDGKIPDSLIGQVVEPVGPNVREKFPVEVKGVILRNEPYKTMPQYHVLMSTGETYRMNETSFKIVSKHKFQCA
jgi:hypothetical protein